MASKKSSLILVVLFICLLSFSSKALARNIANASKPYPFSEEIDLNKKRLLLAEKCGKRIQHPDSAADPECHHYL
ncbi:hypothetical protein MtrunA17_Chr4g0019361 [Medicago truncatula]|uniref:RALF-like protein n=1 Tax=Medicago truncatula TaxID=3880 RepID=A0A072UIB4_MEDTR|nr:RALF-like protein [Medicago truncatula]RHN59913.1 hypothetical protein MtrunA17_Chr4g0019361 [Medicago truncatula]